MSGLRVGCRQQRPAMAAWLDLWRTCVGCSGRFLCLHRGDCAHMHGRPCTPTGFKTGGRAVRALEL